MKKRIMLLSIIMIYLLSVIISPVISADEAIAGIFNSKIDFDYQKESDEPTKIGDQNSIEINVNYKLNVGPFVSLFLGRRITRLILFGPGYIMKLKGYPIINISFSVDSPEWCDAELEPSSFQFELTRQLTAETTTTLTYSLKEDAPALVNESIEVSAEFGGLWTMSQAMNSTKIQIIPEYVSDISAKFENDINITPLKNLTLPINITNGGNGEAIVNITIEESEGWNFSFSKDSITIPVNETKKVELTAKAPKDFENKTFEIKIKPRSTNEDYQGDIKDLEGETVSYSITFSNDGSLKDDDEEGITIDTTILIIILFVIIIFIVLIFLIKRKLK